MPRASKRAKTTTTSGGPHSESPSAPAQPQPLIPFRTGPSLEHIPDDVLHEILSHLPTLRDIHMVFAYHYDLWHPPVVPSAELVRTPTLRALSQTSRLLRSRCLAMAWQSIELCRSSPTMHCCSFHWPIGRATEAAVRVLTACPHLLPLVQTVSVVFTRFRSAEIIPAFAACLAMLPNLTTIQVVYAHSPVIGAIKDGFQGIRLPSVRRVVLPCAAHEIIKSCPNLEEVTCTEGSGNTIIRSLIKADCRRVRVLRGTCVSHTARLAKLLPDLKHISIPINGDMKPLSHFPLLDTIEVIFHDGYKPDLPLSELAASYVEKAGKVLRENKLQAEKTVLLTKWYYDYHQDGRGPDFENGYFIREVVKV